MDSPNPSTNTGKHMPAIKPHSLDECIDQIIEQAGMNLIVGSPLGIGKPNVILNALWQRARQHKDIQLELFTALSLDVPTGSSLLEKRFLKPFTDRHFGDDYPTLDYLQDLRDGNMPDNMRVSEFYMQSGKSLSSPLAQRWYTSSNYTHVARDLADRQVNVLTIMVGCREDEKTGRTCYSLGSNPDITVDLVNRINLDPDRDILVVAQVNRHMPFMTGLAEVDEDYFDILLDDPEFEHDIFAAPRQPINTTDYMIGLNASTLVIDGGSLQIGIGSLGDAFVYATEMRHRDCEHYRRVLSATRISSNFVDQIESVAGPVDSLTSFSEGLYAASEMFTEGFVHLYQSGILKRKVYPDLTIQHLLNEGEITARISMETLDALMAARAITTRLDEVEIDWLVYTGVFREGTCLNKDRIEAPDGKLITNDLTNPKARQLIYTHCLGTVLTGGAVLHAAFFLGSKDFYNCLHQLDDRERELFQMTGVGQINELYGGEARDRAQRVKARFINTTMKMSLTGAATSDGLENHQVVSGVGGQYNFVAMAHALEDSRSILMLRSTRETAAGPISNIVWQYPYETIPRHLRDIVITEYGIADLRGQSDEECIKAMLCITDSRFQQSLLAQARKYGKIDPRWQIPEPYTSNLPDTLTNALAPWKLEGLFPEYPYGCDFTDLELRLIQALRWLKQRAQGRFGKLALLLKSFGAKKTEADEAPLERMGLLEPATREERLNQRLLLLALNATR